MDTLTINSFFNELEKIAEEQQPQGQVTRDSLKRLAKIGLISSLGVGAGYGAGRLVGRPIEKAVLRAGAPNAAKFLRYAVPTATGLGAALTLAQRIKSDKTQRAIAEKR